jgi:hypothetical protein
METINEKIAMALLEVAKARKGEIKLSTPLGQSEPDAG